MNRDATTPVRIDDEIRLFCAEIQPTSTPVYVPVEPVSREFDECINIVNEQVRNHGGSTLIGWAIWHWPYILVEAELHAIWVTPTGRQVDISPKQDGERKILFLPDPNHHFPEQHREPNRRKALMDHPKVIEFLALSDKYKKMLPAPGVQMSIGPSDPIAILGRRCQKVSEEVRKISNVRRKSNWRGKGRE